MAEVVLLPRAFLAQTAHGTAFYWDRKLGLLSEDERTERWRGLSPDELRHGYPEAWWTWTRFAALLPAYGSERLPQPDGGHAA